MSISQSSLLVPLHSYDDFQPPRGDLRAPPLLFGRRPPQSNRLPNIVPTPASWRRLEIPFIKVGISPMTPRNLTATLHSLPTILHMINRIPILSYGEGSRGLSVPLRVSGIFTATTISPSSWPRQCPDRYTIRAGRNLPDKEFRYLRTVIVTAAVYRGFNSTR